MIYFFSFRKIVLATSVTKFPKLEYQSKKNAVNEEKKQVPEVEISEDEALELASYDRHVCFPKNFGHFKVQRGLTFLIY